MRLCDSQGALKHLVIRSGSGRPTSTARGGSAAAAKGAKELMLVFGVTQGSAAKGLKPVAEALGREFPQLVRLCCNAHRRGYFLSGCGSRVATFPSACWARTNRTRPPQPDTALAYQWVDVSGDVPPCLLCHNPVSF